VSYVIQRPDGQWYVTMKPAYGTAWTTDIAEAAEFVTVEEAECVRKWNAEYVKEGGVVTWECIHSRDAKICPKQTV
jgi:hypothetical protein